MNSSLDAALSVNSFAFTFPSFPDPLRDEREFKIVCMDAKKITCVLRLGDWSSVHFYYEPLNRLNQKSPFCIFAFFL